MQTTGMGMGVQCGCSHAVRAGVILLMSGDKNGLF